MVTWTLVIYLVAGGPSIVIEGFRSYADCEFIGRNYQEHVDQRAKFQCNSVRK